MDPLPPPRYSLPAIGRRPVVETDVDLPLYTLQSTEFPHFPESSQSPTFSETSPSSQFHPPQSPRPLSPQRRTERIFQLTNSRNQPWATLKLLSRAASPRNLPTFQQGDSIEGSLALSLEKSDSILSIPLAIRGRVLTGASDTDIFTFFEQSTILWSKSKNNSNDEQRQSAKLSGGYLWPFKISLPTSITPPSALSNVLPFSLPQTFAEKYVRASVQYTLTVEITRGKFRSNDYLSTNFAYIPITKPGPLSTMRQLAYEKDLPIFGPTDDPEGWKTLPLVEIQGTVHGGRNVVVLCTLSLAKPLSYTRGSVIPCVIDLQCADRLALDYLSAQIAAIVCLQRRVKYSVYENGRKDASREEIDVCQSAVWWPSEGYFLTRRMSGEMHLERGLQPSTCIPHFGVDYSVVMRPLEAPTFVPLDSQPILTEPVEIVTGYAEGPRPRALCPPGYGSPPSRERIHDGGSSSNTPFMFLNHA